MKMIISVLDEKDVDRVTTALANKNIRSTRVSSTGSLLIPGNATLLIGVDDERVSQAMSVIAELAALRETIVPYTYEGTQPLTGFAEVEVGGFLSFVLDVDHFEQV